MTLRNLLAPKQLKIALKFPVEHTDFEAKLLSLKERMEFAPREHGLTMQAGLFSSDELVNELKKLNKVFHTKRMLRWLTQEEILILEYYKSYIMQSVEMHLNKKYKLGNLLVLPAVPQNLELTPLELPGYVKPDYVLINDTLFAVVRKNKLLPIKGTREIIEEPETGFRFNSKNKFYYFPKKLTPTQLKEIASLEKKQDIEKSKKNNITKRLYIWFALLIAAEFIPMMIGGFLGVKEILDPVKSLSLFDKYAINLSVCAIEAILFYSMMGPMFKRALGIPLTKKAGELAEIYNKQAKSTNTVNNILLEHADKMSLNSFTQYNKLAKYFNRYTGAITMEKFKESRLSKGFRYTISVLNVILNAAGQYYMMKQLLTAVASSLVGTPLGWSIIVGMIALQLISRTLLRSDNMFYLLNPAANKHDAIKKKIAAFENKQAALNAIEKKKLEKNPNNENELSDLQEKMEKQQSQMEKMADMLYKTKLKLLYKTKLKHRVFSMWKDQTFKPEVTRDDSTLNNETQLVQ